MRPIPLALAFGLAASPAVAGDPIEGDWLVETKRVMVKMGPCPTNPAKLCGKIVWMKEPNDPAGKPKRNIKDPDQARRGDPVMGMLMVRDFANAAPGRWTGGKIYDPNSGRTFDSKMQLQPDGTLKLDGCVLKMICISQTWTRPT
jgi:uncharacterized protein (DUF2147 family)